MANTLVLMLGVAGSALGMIDNSVFRRGGSEQCSNTQLSCHNTSVVENTCCFNAPGGLLLQTQFWDTNPSAGPSNSWTIHGLWPDDCNGGYQANCDPSRAYTNITDILEAAGDSDLVNYMDTYWVSNDGSDESFWEHEWAKHGTCISTLDPQCYPNYQPTEEVPDFFNTVVNLYKTLPTYDWLSQAGITPSNSETYSASDIQMALSQQNSGYEVYIGCDDGVLDEVWYFFNVQGSIQDGTFEPTNPTSTGSCPDSGIQYPPKSGGSGGSGGSGSSN